jgi:glycosyltransferase involved in cell wall biosynthesis
MTTVAICIPTFRRPDELRLLLESLTRLQTVDADVIVVVVDNDRDGSAAQIVDAFRSRLTRLEYAIETVQGISPARNRLARIALEFGADFLAFVDDDELVDEGWLAGLLDTSRTHGAQAVIGPVLPAYDAAVPEWVRRSRHFDRARFPTGTVVRRANTGNSLIATSLLPVGGHDAFHPALATGEDTLFFMRVQRDGARIVWCDEAVVHEHVSSRRGSLSWIVRRAYNDGATFSTCLALLGQTRREKMDRSLRCLGRIGQALALTPLAVFGGGRPGLVRAWVPGASGLGGLVGMIRPSTRASSSSTFSPLLPPPPAQTRQGPEESTAPHR